MPQVRGEQVEVREQPFGDRTVPPEQADLAVFFKPPAGPRWGFATYPFELSKNKPSPSHPQSQELPEQGPGIGLA